MINPFRWRRVAERKREYRGGSSLDCLDYRLRAFIPLVGVTDGADGSAATRNAAANSAGFVQVVVGNYARGLADPVLTIFFFLFGVHVMRCSVRSTHQSQKHKSQSCYGLASEFTEIFIFRTHGVLHIVQVAGPLTKAPLLFSKLGMLGRELRPTTHDAID